MLSSKELLVGKIGKVGKDSGAKIGVRFQIWSNACLFHHQVPIMSQDLFTIIFLKDRSPPPHCCLPALASDSICSQARL